jgi:hypothetical protein
MRRTRFINGVVVALLALGVPVAAQQTEDPPVALTQGQKVWVTTFEAGAHEGRIVGLTGTAIDISTPDGIASWPWAAVQRVDTPDPISDGLRKGAIAGAATGAAWGMMLGYGLRCRSNCGEDYRVWRDVSGGALMGGVFGTGLGVGYGALIDWLVHRRRTVYEFERAAEGVRLIPVFSRHRARVDLTFAWP